jgi:glyoxylase-like metal-dependent hydrolase (beta-lactamase superfamily II)
MFGYNTPSKKYGCKIIDHVYYFSEFPMLDCCMYVLENATGDLTLIDAGNGSSLDKTLESMESLGLKAKKIKNILITHEHLDHVLGLYPLVEMLPTKPEIFAHLQTAKILQEGDEDQICPGSLGISAAEFGVEIKPLPVKVIEYGAKWQFGNFIFQALQTPGHSVGSLTYYDAENKLLFPGDVVFPQGSFGRYDFPGGDLTKLQHSIQRLAELDVKYLCAGHMQFVDNGSKHIQRSLQNIMNMRW